MKAQDIFFRVKSRLSDIMKGVIVCSIFAMHSFFMSVQTEQTQVYDNFEGSRAVTYDIKSGGRLETSAKNISRKGINTSAQCGKYTRHKEKRYDNIKINLNGRLSDVAPYATYIGTPPKFKMKVFTNAPVGTAIELQLGNKSGKEYPASIHSQYRANTSKRGEWEEIEFVFSHIPQGSMVSSTEVDQILLLFNPDSNTYEVFYFDDFTGPQIQQAVTKKEHKKK